MDKGFAALSLKRTQKWPISTGKDPQKSLVTKEMKTKSTKSRFTPSPWEAWLCVAVTRAHCWGPGARGGERQGRPAASSRGDGNFPEPDSGHSYVGITSVWTGPGGTAPRTRRVRTQHTLLENCTLTLHTAGAYGSDGQQCGQVKKLL